jgi:hypothetical protein
MIDSHQDSNSALVAVLPDKFIAIAAYVSA